MRGRTKKRLEGSVELDVDVLELAILEIIEAELLATHDEGIIGAEILDGHLLNILAALDVDHVCGVIIAHVHLGAFGLGAEDNLVGTVTKFNLGIFNFSVTKGDRILAAGCVYFRALDDIGKVNLS